MDNFQNLTELDTEDNTQERTTAIQRSTWVSVIVNLLLTVFQVVAGIISGSQGLIADGIHSLSDLIADFAVLIAAHHSKKEADEEHQYGHQRYENLASLALGILLLVVGVAMVWSATHKLQDPESIAIVQPLALWVALIALVAKELLFRYMLAIAERVRSSMLVANAWHARSDAASSLVVAIGIGGNLMGWSFVWNATHDLTDHAATKEQIESIAQEILNTPGVLGFHELKTRKTGDLILADVHLEINGSLTVTEGHEIAREAKLKVMARHPVLYLMTHVDPVPPNSSRGLGSSCKSIRDKC